MHAQKDLLCTKGRLHMKFVEMSVLTLPQSDWSNIYDKMGVINVWLPVHVYLSTQP